MDKDVVEIRSRDFWFKIVEFLQQNWALIDANLENSGVTVFFIHDGSGVFDTICFETDVLAEAALRRNGFQKYSEDEESRKFIASPAPPFFKAAHPNGKIYSSGRYWKS